MKQHDFTGIIPAQYTGKEIEAISSVEMKDENEAKAFYEIVKDRLQNVNNWHRLAGFISAKFQVVDSEGKEVDRYVIKGDYLKIDIPGPGSKEGDGYDWVCIEELKEEIVNDNQSIGFRVRPSKNPCGEKNETAHFYSHEATSSFIATREKSTISAWIVDRNIKPNDHAESLTDKIRDTTVGIGAIGMFSKIQWQNLAEGLTKKGN
jgi:hypothetical protein